MSVSCVAAETTATFAASEEGDSASADHADQNFESCAESPAEEGSANAPCACWSASTSVEAPPSPVDWSRYWASR